MYIPHHHGWVKLVTLAGSIHLCVDGVWHDLKAGDVFEMPTNTLHEGVVGPDGWRWLAAWKSDEEAAFDAPDALPRPID